MNEARKRNTKAIAFIAIILLLYIHTPKGVHFEIGAQIKRAEGRENILPIIEKYIHKGMPKIEVEKFFSKNGFRTRIIKEKDETILIGSYIDHHVKFLGLFYDETRVNVTLRNEKVEEVSAWFFYFNGL